MAIWRRAACAVTVALAVSACGPVRLVPEDDGVMDEPAGPIVPLGEVREEGSPRIVTYEGFENTDGGFCIRSEIGLDCGDQPPGEVPSLPANAPESLSWVGGGGDWCVEAEVQDGIDRVVITDAAGTDHVLTALVAARQFGVNLHAGCWVDGASPQSLTALQADGTAVYTETP